MKLRWFVLGRLAWTAVAVWALLTVGFLVYAYTPDPNVDLVRFAAGQGALQDGGNVSAAQEEAVAAYREARNYDQPVLERYARWVVNYATLNWGWSFMENRPVRAVLADTGLVTLAYLVPGLVVGTLFGAVVGVAAAVDRGPLDRLATVVAYAGVGTPAFLLAELSLLVAVEQFGWLGVRWDARYGLWTAQNADAVAVPGVVVALNVFAVQVRYARAEALEYLPADFVKRLRASGASTYHRARHVARNAAVPLVSLFFTETLGLLFVTIYVVEVVTGVPGVGKVFYDAVQNKDIGLVLASILLPSLVVLLGNLLQDLLYAVLDPRVGRGDG